MTPIHGALVIDKPEGPTSHDVVDFVRRITGERRVGHTGTLDPMASGVLVTLIGSAARLAEFLVGHDKAYRARVLLGRTSDTYDLHGEVHDDPGGAGRVDVDRPRVEAALASFRGTFLQTPPPFSARRVDGRRAYARARAGQPVRLPPQPVRVDALTLARWEPPELDLELSCSSGTYVRSIAHDLGVALGCGAVLAGLRRTRAGAFSLDDAATPEQLESAPGAWRARLLTPAQALRGMPAVRVDDDRAIALRQGRDVTHADLDALPDAPIAVLDDAGDLVGIARRDADMHVLRPRKMFLPH